MRTPPKQIAEALKADENKNTKIRDIFLVLYKLQIDWKSGGNTRKKKKENKVRQNLSKKNHQIVSKRAFKGLLDNMVKDMQ